MTYDIGLIEHVHLNFAEVRGFEVEHFENETVYLGLNVENETVLPFSCTIWQIIFFKSFKNEYEGVQHIKLR